VSRAETTIAGGADAAMHFRQAGSGPEFGRKGQATSSPITEIVHSIRGSAAMVIGGAKRPDVFAGAAEDPGRQPIAHRIGSRSDQPTSGKSRRF
jgi:hypothetical protein